jgi:hypothetical protein
MNDINKLRNYFAAQAMKALIEARAHLPEESPDSIHFAMECGVNGLTDIHKEDDSKYAWGEILAEEAFELANWMMEQVKKRGTYD